MKSIPFIFKMDDYFCYVSATARFCDSVHYTELLQISKLIRYFYSLLTANSLSKDFWFAINSFLAGKRFRRLLIGIFRYKLKYIQKQRITNSITLPNLSLSSHVGSSLFNMALLYVTQNRQMF